MSRDYAARRLGAGDDQVALVVLPGQGHFEHIDPAEQAWHTAAAWLRDAVDVTSREHAEALDAADPLAPLRGRASWSTTPT